MSSFASDPIDLTGAAAEARARVEGLSVIDSLLAYSTLIPFADFRREKAAAESLIAQHPLQSLFSTVHFSRDGRVVHRSGGQGGAPIYGVDPATWRQMIQSHDFRVRLYVQAMLWPAWAQLTNEHHLSLGDFVTIVRSTGIVPGDRTYQFARALHHGYEGDFSSAMQLLAPQFESLVRHHLSNAGVSTSTITAEQTEEEIGLSSLMERSVVEEVLNPDIAFEIRALLCGPIGPNLRNEVAHGLISDAEASSPDALYLWWFALKLVFIPYWNELHDTSSVGAREPTRPRERPERGESDEPAADSA